MELSKLSIKCLANTPMLTDTMTTAINELYNSIFPYYEDYLSFLNREIVSDKRGGYRIYKTEAYFIEIINKTLPLSKINLSFIWDILLSEDKKTDPITFVIRFSYDMVDDQNILYIQLSESSDTSFFKPLLKSSDFIKLKSSSKEYQYIDSEHEKRVWVQFIINETLSSEKIKTCSELFKTNILMPILNQLKKK